MATAQVLGAGAVFEIRPEKIDADFLQTHAALAAPAALAVVAALAPLLNGEGELAADPRRTDWRAVVRPALAEHGVSDTLVADESPLAEALNVAFALHECAGANADMAFLWMIGPLPKEYV